MITATNLNKQFRSPVTKEGAFKGLRTLFARGYTIKQAVNEINFHVESGEFVGYIGPNGAGKSTTIKMLCGILHPTSGEVSVMGMNPHRERRAVARKLGVLFGQRSGLWWDLPAIDSYDIMAAMYGIDQPTKKARLAQLTELLDMDSFLATPVRKLSLGQRMRADIAAALLHDPDILFLDEPTIGLDIVAKRSIRAFLRRINREQGKTILLTTHDMDDIEQLCNRVIVINGGTLGFDGTIDELRRRIGLPTAIHITFSEQPRPIRLAEDLPLQLASVQGNTATVICSREAISAMDALRYMEQFGKIADVHMEEPAFEELIHRIY